MPDKEGSEDNKSTKSVVNKKQKQMMGEMKQQKQIIPSGQGLTDYSKVPKVTGLGGGGGGTNSITDAAPGKSLKKRVKDVGKILTFPLHKRRKDSTEKFASEEVAIANSMSGGGIAGSVEAGDEPPVKKKKKTYAYGGTGSRKMWMNNK